MSAQVFQYGTETSARLDRARQQELCQHIRRLIQEHSLELANGRAAKSDTLDEALRNVWILEQAMLQS